MTEPTIGEVLRETDAILAWWSHDGRRDLVAVNVPEQPLEPEALIAVMIVQGEIFQLARNGELELYVEPPTGGPELEEWLDG